MEILTVDIGGKGSRRGIVKNGKVTNYVAANNGEVKSFDDLLCFVQEGIFSGVTGIACGIAGNIQNGVMINSPNASWLNGFDIEHEIYSRFGIKTRAYNDAQAFTAGQAWLLRLKHFIGSTWSSGYGIRELKNKIIPAYCEIAHIRVDYSPYAALCGCGLRGCLETVIGGEAVKRRVISEMAALGRAIPDGMHPCAFLDQLYIAGDKWAASFYDIIAMAMGANLASICNNSGVSIIVWKGTFAENALPLIENRIRKYMVEGSISPKFGSDVQFIFSPEPINDGLIGAAALFRGIYK